MEKQSSYAMVVGTQYATMVRIPVLYGGNCVGYDYYSLPDGKRLEAQALGFNGLLGADCVAQWGLRRVRKERF